MKTKHLRRNPSVRSHPERAEGGRQLGTRFALAAGALLFAPACQTTQRAGPQEAAAPSGALPTPAAPRYGSAVRDVDPKPSARELAEVDRQLEAEARLETIEKLAFTRNPDLFEARERVRAAQELAPAMSRLPDPEVEYQLWAAPLLRPYALDQAEMHMFGIRQAFPAPGTLSARSQAASEQARVLSKVSLARGQDLLARVRRAYAEYRRAYREYAIHVEHAAIGQRILDLARASYQSGRGTQQDVLRTLVELSRLHNSLAKAERDRHSARGLLNTLMARPVDAPLGAPLAAEVPKLQVRFRDLQRQQSQDRPEIGVAESSIRVRASELESARSSAHWPSFMVGAQYMYVPHEAAPHNYGVMLSMSLPWFNPRYGEEVRAAEATLAAEQHALSSVRNIANYELYDAVQRLESAADSFAIIERDLLPQALQSFESIQAAYRGGQGDSLALLDALRALLDVRLEHERALARFETARADLERAVGTTQGARFEGTSHE